MEVIENIENIEIPIVYFDIDLPINKKKLNMENFINRNSEK
jgi:hypothetical protein